jgi:Sulfatase-modifying factor enzyme 1/Caspase domain/NB-ARC domain/Tetratricopeptide repeat
MTKKAFIIGANVSELAYNDHDIRLISEAFRQHEFEIIHSKGKKFEVLEAFENVINRCKSTDSLVFYYSGYGTVVREKLFLEYHDETSFNIKAIFNLLQRCAATHKLIILDICNSQKNAVDWIPPLEDANFGLLTTAERLQSIKEINSYKASFLTYHIHKALTKGYKSGSYEYLINKENAITLDALNEYLMQQAIAYNESSKVVKVQMPQKWGQSTCAITTIDATHKRREQQKDFIIRLKTQLKAAESLQSQIKQNLINAEEAYNQLDIHLYKKELDVVHQSIKVLKDDINFATHVIRGQFAPADKDPASDVPIHLNSVVQMAQPNPNFVGREELITQILDKIINHERISITGVNGFVGIGKTAILIEICHFFKESWKEEPNYPPFVAKILKGKKYFTDGFLWICLEAAENLNVVVENIYTQLGLENKGKNMEESLKILVSILKYKNVLIVLDGVEQNLQNFRILYHRFAHLPIIITSRIHFEDTPAIKIPQLSQHNAYQLFLKHFKSEVRPEQTKCIETLCEWLNHSPLGIKILANYARVYAIDMVELMDSFELIQAAARLRHTELSETKNFEISKNLANFYCFKISYCDLSQLTKDILNHASRFSRSFPKTAIASDFQNQDITQALNELVDLGLMDFDTRAQRYSIQPLLREFAVLNTRESGVIDMLYMCKKQIYLNSYAKDLSEDAITDMIATVEHIFKKGDLQTVIELTDKFSESLFYRGLWDKNAQLLKFAIESTQNKSEKASYLVNLGDVLGRQGNRHEAIEWFEKALELKLSYFAHYSICAEYYRLDEFEKSHYLNFKHLRNSFIDGYKGVSHFTKTLGWIANDYYWLEKGAKLATVVFKQHLHALEEGIVSRANFIKAIWGLFSQQMQLRHLNQADIVHYTHKLLNYAQHYQVPEMVSYFNEQLFNQYLYHENLTLAKETLENYKKTVHHLGIKDSWNHVNIYEARLLFHQGAYEAALPLFFELKNEHQKNYWLGKTYLRLDDFAQAEKYLQLVLAHFEAKQNAVEMAAIYVELALLDLKQNFRLDAAKKLALAVNTKLKFGLKTEVFEQKVVEQFNAQYDHSFETLHQELFKDEFIDVLPNFLIRNLPKQLVINNSIEHKKEMLLIPEGNCFITQQGVSDVVLLDIDFILNNVDDFWQDKYTNLPQATELYLYPYYIDKHPVTNAAYKRFCIATDHPMPPHWEKNFDIAERALQPVVGVSYEDATKYAKFVNKELPSGAEWEKAFWAINYAFYADEMPTDLSAEKNTLLAAIAEDNLVQGNDKKWFLQKMVGEPFFHYLMENQTVLDDWNRIDKKTILYQADFQGDFENGCYLELIPDVAEALKRKFNWKLLMQLLCYSLTSNGFEKKLQILKRLPKLNENQIITLFEIYLNEAIELYRLPTTNQSMATYFLSEKNHWAIAVKSFIGFQSDLGLQRPRTPEFIAKNKIKYFYKSKTGISIRTAVIRPNDIPRLPIGFRCVKPIFGNQDLTNYLKLSEHDV